MEMIVSLYAVTLTRALRYSQYLFLWWSNDSNLAIPMMVRWQRVEGQSMRMYWRLNKIFVDPQKNKYYSPGIRFVFLVEGYIFSSSLFTSWPCCHLIKDQGFNLSNIRGFHPGLRPSLIPLLILCFELYVEVSLLCSLPTMVCEVADSVVCQVAMLPSFNSLWG